MKKFLQLTFKLKFSLLVLMGLGLLFSNAAKAQDVDWDHIIIKEDSLPHELEERLVQLAWKHFPDNKSLQLTFERAEKNIRLTRQSWLDNLNLQYQYNLQSTANNPTQPISLPRFGAGVTINMSSIFNRPIRVEMAKKDRDIVSENIKRQKLFIRARTLQFYQTYLVQLDIVRSLTEAAEDAYTLSIINKKNFENGTLSADEYTRTLTNHMMLVQQQKTAEQNMLNARVNLEEMIGVRLEQVEREFNPN